VVQYHSHNQHRRYSLNRINSKKPRFDTRIIERAAESQAKRDLGFGAAQQLVGSVSERAVLETGMGESVSPGTQTTYFVLLLLAGPGTHALGMTRRRPPAKRTKSLPFLLDIEISLLIMAISGQENKAQNR
jgi:hypothetical protein